MGLDMYLEGRTFNFERQKTSEGFKIKGLVLELGYWRKHPNLHGYIVQTFADGVDECQDIDLSAEQLRQTLQAIKDRNLPHTEGFFFGRSDMSNQEVLEDTAIIEKAIEWLETKIENVSKYVVYRASW